MTNSLYVLLFDGNCRICTSQAHLIADYDRNKRVELLDVNGIIARTRFPQITPQDAQRELHLAAPDGELYRGAEAVRQTLLLLPGFFGWLGRLMHFPGAMLLARPVYAWIARNRYRLGGRTTCEGDVCNTHSL